MEALYFLKFWRPTSTSKATQNSDATQNLDNPLVVECDNDFDEEDDSFFDLELSFSDFDNCNKTNRNIDATHKTHQEDSIFGSSEDSSQNPNKTAGDFGLTCSQPLNDHYSKRRIIPIELNSKPQSPVSLLKAAPKFRLFMFNKSKSMATHKTEKTEEKPIKGVSFETPKHEKHESKLFTVKFKVKEAPSLYSFTRVSSLRSNASFTRKKSRDDESESCDSSKRFPKEVIQKYFKLINPLHVKSSKRRGDKLKFSEESAMPSPAASPAAMPVYSPKKEKQGNIPAGIREVCKHLVKSKSSSSAAGASSPASRRDDSLLLQHDGIQSAILHCKQSFNSPRGSSSSQCTDDSSKDKLIKSSSVDSCLSSQSSSNSSFEISIDLARKSNRERNT